MQWLWWLMPVAGYLAGSVSFAYWAGRAKGIDLREHGSKNLGATNAGRVLGGRWFAVVFTADLLKGLVPVLIAGIGEREGVVGLALTTAAAAILGHVLPCFHGFKGGKAVATSLGVLIGLVWKAALVAASVWLLIWLIARLARFSASEAVGPASIVAAAAVPVAHLAIYPNPWSGANIALTLFVLLAAAVVLVKHRSNAMRIVERLRSGPPAA